MNRKDLYKGFIEVDDEILERSETAAQSRKHTPWIKRGTMAACLGLIIAAAIAASDLLPERAPALPHVSDPSVLSGLEQTEGNSNTEGPWNPWQAHFNEVTTVLDAARVYIPGYFTEDLSEEEIAAIEPGMRHEWMQYSGHAGFDGYGNLVGVHLTVTTMLPETNITIAIAQGSSTRDYVLSKEPVVSVCEQVEYKVYQWVSGENSIELAADASINGFSYSFTLTVTPQTLEQANEDFTRVLECFAYYADGRPNLDAVTANEIPEWFDNTLTHAQALNDQSYGAYMLPVVPNGFSAESIRRYRDQNFDYLSGLWTSGYDEIRWIVYTISEADEIRLTRVGDTENYDLSLYPIPRASSVPKELREIVDNPIFTAEELTLDAVWARAYKTGETGDGSGWRMAFSVKYGDSIVEVRTKGVDPEWVYQQLVDLIAA